MELISIVMPVKNAEPFLKECLNSILNQSETAWELLAVNDHSDDHSFKVLQQYAEKDQRISVFQNKGSGIIDALKTAYERSSGYLIHRMDADDIMPIQKLEKLKKALDHHGKGHVATGAVKYFSADGVSEGYFKYEQWLNKLCKNDRHWQELYKECVIPSPCWLIHRSDFEACGGFNSDIYPEDYDLCFRLYERKIKVVSIDDTLHLWRDHQDRTSRNHIHYQQNAFFEIKLHYFLKFERDRTRPLMVWGAGKKGKIMAKLLQAKHEPFQWVSNNPKKEGKEIYNQLMHSFESILTVDKPQIIITVAQRDSKDEIVDFLEAQNLKATKDYWFFR